MSKAKRSLRKVKRGFKKAVSKIKHKKTRRGKAVLRKKKPLKLIKKKKIIKAKPVLDKKIAGKKAVRKRVAASGIPIEVAVSKSKFYAPSATQEVRLPPPALNELPSCTGKDKLVLQVRDPWWIHAYWEITLPTWERLKNAFPAISTGNFKKILRIYDVSHIIFDGSNAHRFFDIEVNSDTNNWYIDTQGPGRWWCVDFGLLFEDNRFVTVLRSNTVMTPLDGPSWIIDEEWMIPDEMFARLYGVGGGSSPLHLKQLWKERKIGSGSLSL